MRKYIDYMEEQEATRRMTWAEVDECEDADRLRTEVRRLQRLMATAYVFVGRKVTSGEAKTARYRDLIREASEQRQEVVNE